MKYIASIFVLAACSGGPAPSEVPNDSPEVAGNAAASEEPEALAYVRDRLVGTFTGSWTIAMLGPDDKSAPGLQFTDRVVGSNARIDGDRAIVDVTTRMDMGRGEPMELSFIEGVKIEEGGKRGVYFVEMQGQVTTYEEVEPGTWQSDAPLTEQDYAMMVNVTADNVVEGNKRTVKVVKITDGLERHDITATVTVKYTNASGEPVSVEYTAMTGHHQQVADATP